MGVLGGTRDLLDLLPLVIAVPLMLHHLGCIVKKTRGKTRKQKTRACVMIPPFHLQQKQKWAFSLRFLFSDLWQTENWEVRCGSHFSEALHLSSVLRRSSCLRSEGSVFSRLSFLPVYAMFLFFYQFTTSTNKLAEKVRLSLKYEEAKRR